jgi:polyisoprenoid-binding protein YceI
VEDFTMRSLLILAAATALVSQASFAKDNYSIDPAHTSVIWKVNHMGFSNVYGMFPGVSGSFTIDEAKPEKSNLDLTIQTDSVTTHVPKRDEHLRSPDFFNVKQFPTITFKSKSVKKTDAKHYTIAGDLTMHGVTKPVSFVFNRFNTGKDPMGQERTGGEAALKVKRSEFGMSFMNGPGKVGDDIEIMISVEGIKG